MTPPTELKARFAAAGQDHVLGHWGKLDPEGRRRLVADLETVDLEELGRLAHLIQEPAPGPDHEIEPLPQVVKGADPAADARAADAGWKCLAAGQVAAFVVAGGQGTRLGHPGPKGTFAATPVKRKPLFQLFAEKILARGRRAGKPVPWYVMTSPENHQETLAFFEAHQRFGIEPRDLFFLVQGSVPAVDAGGKLLLAAPDRLFRSPDGHGGSFRALKSSGALADMAARGVEEIFYFQVDNPLVQICDPVFLGHHLLARSDFSSKSVPKRDPHEKVGVLVRRNGQPGVIEYSDLPPALREAREPDGSLTFRAGNIAIHVLRRSFAEELTAGGLRLPWHVARKDIPCVGNDGSPRTVQGAKFETFVFDALPFARETLVLEVERRREFSPIKNREGEDSPASSRRDQIALFAVWLREAGIAVPEGDEGIPDFAIEISPLFAQDRDELRRRRDRIRVTGDDLLLDGR